MRKLSIIAAFVVAVAVIFGCKPSAQNNEKRMLKLLILRQCLAVKSRQIRRCMELTLMAE